MNYIKGVAKLLGVEIDEKFIVHCENHEDHIVILRDDGLWFADEDLMAPCLLGHILSGRVEIEKFPWKPKLREIYYCVGSSGHAFKACFYDTSSHLNNYKLGNCYKTIEEANANKDKWITYYKEIIDEICKD